MMADGQTDLDRSEAASPFKLQKAHDRGSIFRSMEVTFAVVLLALTACAYGLGESTLRRAGQLLFAGLSMSGRPSLEPQGALSAVWLLAVAAAQVVAPLLFVVWIAATGAAALQARGVFSAEPLRPDFSRLNPAQGFKKLFSLRSLIDLMRNAVKLLVLGVAAVLWGTDHLGDMLSMQQLPVRAQAALGLRLVAGGLGMVATLYIVFALFDWLFNRWDFGRQMRMSKREMKDEHKEREGDPRIKGRLRELRQEWLRKARTASQVKGADVLVTNPTHYAVALHYRHGQTPAPVIQARGIGELALRMREAARRHGVPIVENPPLARALYKVPGETPFVPEAQFHDVARILRWVYAARRGTHGAAA
jgi:flagellar biosynthesis protein FlhB